MFTRILLRSDSDHDLSSNHWLQNMGHHSAVEGTWYISPGARVRRDSTGVVCEHWRPYTSPGQCEFFHGSTPVNSVTDESYFSLKGK